MCQTASCDRVRSNGGVCDYQPGALLRLEQPCRAVRTRAVVWGMLGLWSFHNQLGLRKRLEGRPVLAGERLAAVRCIQEQAIEAIRLRVFTRGYYRDGATNMMSPTAP